MRCRRGDAPVVADLLTAAVWVGEVGYARDVVALLIAKGWVSNSGAESAIVQVTSQRGISYHVITCPAACMQPCLD